MRNFREGEAKGFALGMRQALHAKQLRACQTELIDEVMQPLVALNPELLAHEANRHCRDDLAYHLEYQSAAMAINDPMPFADYLRWLAEILQGRGLSTDRLQLSLELLADHLGARGMEWAEAALAILLTGKTAQEHAAAQSKTTAVSLTHLPISTPTLTRMVGAMLAGDRLSARDLAISQMAQGCRLAALGAGIIQSAMYEIGSAVNDFPKMVLALGADLYVRDAVEAESLAQDAEGKRR